MFTHTGSITRIGDNSSASVLSISGGNATFAGDIIIPNGKINTIGGNNLTISGTVASHAGISFATNSILPCVIGAITNNVVDLGQVGNVYKNLYLGSEIISGGGATFASDVTVDGKLKVANRWDNSTLANNAIYAQNTTDGFAFGVGTAISTWFAWDSTQGQNSMISVYNDGSKVTIHENLYLGNVDTSSNATSALVLNSSGTNEVEKRTLGTGAFGPTPVGAYLPLAGGTMSGNIVMGDNDITGIDELKFTSGTKLGDNGGTNYVSLTYAASDGGGILVKDGDNTIQGYLYADGGATSSFGLLDGTGSWAVRCLRKSICRIKI